MSFTVFQTATATLNKLGTDGYGGSSVDDTLSVKIDPTFGYKRTFNTDGEMIDGVETIISGIGLQDFFDETHRKWSLKYKSKDWKVERATPFYKVGTDVLEHIEVILS